MGTRPSENRIPTHFQGLNICSSRVNEKYICIYSTLFRSQTYTIEKASPQGARMSPLRSHTVLSHFPCFPINSCRLCSAVTGQPHGWMRLYTAHLVVLDSPTGDKNCDYKLEKTDSSPWIIWDYGYST